MRSHTVLPFLLGTAIAGNCPFMGGSPAAKRDADSSIEETTKATEEFMDQFKLNDTQGYLTTDWGTQIDDQASLKAGMRGPTLLEDFAFRQKLQRFDHERVRFYQKQKSQVSGVDVICRSRKE